MSPGVACQCWAWNQQTNSSASTPMHVSWPTNRRSWKPLCSRSVM